MLLVTASLCKRATDPWSIRPPGVVWEFIARTKTASGHLYRGLRSYGPKISARWTWKKLIQVLLVTASLCKRASDPFVRLGDPKSLSANLFVEAQEGPGSKRQATSFKRQASSVDSRENIGYKI